VDPSQLIVRSRSLYAALTPTQRVSLAAAFAVVVLVVGGSAYWLQQPTYALLFADLDPEAANDVVSRLKTSKVAYRLEDGGRTVRVPASRVDELRLEFASGGMPSSGRIGFEIFDRTAFGATEFLEQVNYRRALEGEIARTIGTLAEVSSARVHIAMAKTSLFASKEQPAKASVVLKLRHGSPLPPAVAQGIANLVASSVEGLRPDAVVILDSYGHPLVRPQDGDDEPLGGAQMERQQRLERDLTAKVVALLEPVVGPGGVHVNVSARLENASEEATEEKWDPTSQAIRSRQVSGEGAGLAGAQGLAGSRANLPPPLEPGDTEPAAQTAAAQTEPLPARGSETTNYEISKTVRHTIRPRGDLARLSVAVILDNETVSTTGADGKTTTSTRPRTAEELQKIHGLVAAAVGLDPARGDQLTIENVPFEEAPAEDAPSETMWQRVTPTAFEGLRIVGVILLGALAFFMVVRPLMRKATITVTAETIEPPALPGGMPRSIRDLEGEVEAQLDAALGEKTPEQLKLPVLTRRLAALTAREPEHAARLIRMWMAEDNH
jgi:flagellar M-ring protein FliF